MFIVAINTDSPISSAEDIISFLGNIQKTLQLGLMRGAIGGTGACEDADGNVFAQIIYDPSVNPDVHMIDFRTLERPSDPDLFIEDRRHA